MLKILSKFKGGNEALSEVFSSWNGRIPDTVSIEVVSIAIESSWVTVDHLIDYDMSHISGSMTPSVEELLRSYLPQEEDDHSCQLSSIRSWARNGRVNEVQSLLLRRRLEPVFAENVSCCQTELRLSCHENMLQRCVGANPRETHEDFGPYAMTYPQCDDRCDDDIVIQRSCDRMTPRAYDSAFIEAARAGHLAVLRLFFTTQHDWSNQILHRALLAASIHGHAHIVNELLAKHHQFSVDESLLASCVRGHPEVVPQLLQIKISSSL